MRESLEDGVGLGLVHGGHRVLLVAVDIASVILVYQLVQVVEPGLVRLLELVVEDFGVIDSIPTSESPHPDDLIDNIQAISRNAGLLVLFNQQLRIALEFLKREGGLRGRFLLVNHLLDFQGPEVVLLDDVVAAPQAPSIGHFELCSLNE